MANPFLYAVNAASKLLWFRHLGAENGSFTWQGPSEVSQGWNFKHVFSGATAFCTPLNIRRKPPSTLTVARCRRRVATFFGFAMLVIRTVPSCTNQIFSDAQDAL